MSVLVGLDNFVSELWKKLDADTTLQGASYLNSTTSIHKYRKPTAAPNPSLLIRADVTTEQDGARAHEALVTVTAYADNIAGDSPDGNRLAMICARASEVLETMQPYVGGGIRIHTMRTLGFGGPYLDPKAPDEHWSYVRLRSLFAYT